MPPSSPSSISRLVSPGEFVSPPKLRAGDSVAVLSPALAAPAIGPDVHEQAMRRLAEATGLVPVEYPTTRRLDATPVDRAADLMAAFRDPSIGAVLTTLGGDDQITVVPHLDPAVLAAHPTMFIGNSDNTNVLNWLWCHGIAGYYGGSTQVHIGAGPAIDPVHLISLRAALLDGGRVELTEPGESEDYGHDWLSPRALSEYGERVPTEPWWWAGPEASVTGRTWGGCLDVLDQIAIADRFPSLEALEGAVLLLETSEEVPPVPWVRRQVRALGERGLLEAVSGVLVARASASSPDAPSTPAGRAEYRTGQRQAIVDEVTRYNPSAVICVGPPFGHTRPQWIMPYGGVMMLDGVARRVVADYG